MPIGTTGKCTTGNAAGARAAPLRGFSGQRHAGDCCCGFWRCARLLAGHCVLPSSRGPFAGQRSGVARAAVRARRVDSWFACAAGDCAVAVQGAVVTFGSLRTARDWNRTVTTGAVFVMLALLNWGATVYARKQGARKRARARAALAVDK